MKSDTRSTADGSNGAIEPAATIRRVAEINVNGADVAVEVDSRKPLLWVLRDDALQCGYCTSGMIMSGAALLRRNPSPSRSEIVRRMESIVCRCGVYNRIVAAIQSVAKTPPEDDR
jgi:aerobic-type carbon monoxide dehydrogenase small subunit (CoxS/CutS family)